MRPANAGALLAVPHVGGGLIGGASLKADDFLAIARAAAGVRRWRRRACVGKPTWHSQMTTPHSKN